MNSNRILPTLLGLLLFFSGIVISLSLSGTMLWGEIEARVFMHQADAGSLKLECPLMIAPWETATIHAVVKNTLTDKTVTPQVNAMIGQDGDYRVVSETLNLAPRESYPMQWDVDASDIVFDRLILVNIHQRPYRDLPSHQGICSIVVFELLGLNGANTLAFIVTVNVLMSLLGIGVVYYVYRPFSERLKSIVQLNIIFFLLVFLGLITALFRLWGLTLIFDAAALLIFTTGNVEIFFPRSQTP